MKYLLLFLILLIFSGCLSKTSNTTDSVLNIDIFKESMTYEKFKQTIRNVNMKT